MSEKSTTFPGPVGAAQPTTWRKKIVVLSSLFALLYLSHTFVPALDELPSFSDVFSFGSVDFASQCPQVAPIAPAVKSEELSAMEVFLESDAFRNASIARLSGAVQIPSMSYDDLGAIGEDKRWDIFYELAAYLEKSYPLVHQTFELEKVNTHGLAYTWLGSDSALKPIILMAHQDVVPVPSDTVASWTHPPFSGHYDGKLIWGRGSSDCKNSLTGILEALELLIAAGFKPTRTIVLSFGFDEESSGHEGAGHLSEFLLKKLGKDSIAVIVDEGAGVSSMWGATFATPGVAEKGYIDVNIVVRMPGGHSSIPPNHNGIGVMSELITHIEANLYESKLFPENPYLGLLQCGAAHSPKFPSKLKKLLTSRSAKTCSKKKDRLAIEAAKESLAIKYLMTTSVAADVILGGVKVNALPERTKVTVNHRINVGEHPSMVKERLAYLTKHVASKYNLTVNAFDSEDETPSSINLSARPGVLEPAPVTPTTVNPISPYAILSGTTRALYGEQMFMAPGIMTGNTDTRYFWELSKHIFRYNPGYDPEQQGLGNIHTVDESISVKAHLNLIKWYSMYIRNMDQAELA